MPKMTLQQTILKAAEEGANLRRHKRRGMRTGTIIPGTNVEKALNRKKNEKGSFVVGPIGKEELVCVICLRKKHYSLFVNSLKPRKDKREFGKSRYCKQCHTAIGSMKQRGFNRPSAVKLLATKDPAHELYFVEAEGDT